MKFKKPDSLKLSTKKFKLNRRIVGIVVVILAGTVIGILVFGNLLKKSPKVAKADCIGISKHADELIAQSKYKEAYSNLTPVLETCAKAPEGTDLKNPDKAQQYVQSVTFNSNLAVAAYGLGDKKQAKVYAEQGLRIRKEMTIQHDNKISPEQKDNFNNTLIALYKIQQGVYYVDESAAQ